MASCATDEKDTTAKMSPEEIYAEAKDIMKGWQPQEKLEKQLVEQNGWKIRRIKEDGGCYEVYAFDKNGDRVNALMTLDRFMKLNPASPAIDYALYLKGTINFADDLGLMSKWFKQDLAERDQMAARDSFEAYKELVTRFPESKYSPDATLRMRHIVNLLAKSELKVARHYYNKGAYVAAVNRAQSTLNDYPTSEAAESALIILIESYQALGLTQLSEDTQRVLKASFPNSTFFPQPAKAPKEKKSWFIFW